MSLSGNQISFSIGFVLVGSALVGLWVNEGRFDYSKAARSAIALTDTNRSASDKTISYSGPLAPISLDVDCAEAFQDYLQVERQAEIYCWVRRTSDNKTTWRRQWHPLLQSNSRNRGLTQLLGSVTYTLKQYQIGDLKVSGHKLLFVNDSEPIPIREIKLSDYGKKNGLSAESDYFYIRKHPGNHDDLGDERIRYLGIPAAPTATYFGLISDGVGVGQEIESRSGILSEIIRDNGRLHYLVNGDRGTSLASMKNHVSRLKWIFRAIGISTTIIGIAFTMNSLLHLLIGLPIIGRLIGGGVVLFSLVIGLTLSTATIAVSWIAHHPFLLLAIVLILTVLAKWLMGKRKSSRDNARSVLGSLEPSIADEASHGNPRSERIFQHLVKLAVSDASFDERENQFLADWARARKIPDEKIVTLFNEAKRDRTVEPPATQREDLPFLISLALADDHMSSKEYRRISRFARKVGVNLNQLNDLIADIQAGKLNLATR